MLFPVYVSANDIPGILPIQPPSLQGKLQLQYSNDYFTVVSNRDDYRTQQISLSGFITENWLLVVDQSILTAKDRRSDKSTPTTNKGRLDQNSISLAYRTYFKQSDSSTEQILLGFGFRSVGDFGGSNIQNSAHKLFRNEMLNLPYVSTNRTDSTIWIRASTQNYLSNFIESRWRYGYWLDGTTLLTSDGQSDGTLGLYGLAQYDDWDFWSGLRLDWRTGYNRDYVQQTVAEKEQGSALVLGVSFGPLRWELIEGIAGSDNSFGRMILTASGDTDVNSNFIGSQFSYQFSVFSPDVAVQSQIRWSEPDWHSSNIARYSIVLDYRYATPSVDKNLTQFNISNQTTIGIEALLTSESRKTWVLPYVILGVGKRTEYIEGEAALNSIQSNNVTSTVLVSDIGFRFNLAGKANSWLTQLHLGYTFWYPLNKKDVVFNGKSTTLLKPDSSSMLGINLQFNFD